MKTEDYSIRIQVDESPEVCFSAILQVRDWWGEGFEGSTEKSGDEFTYHYEDVHRCKMKLVEFVPHKKISWQVLENYFNFTQDPNEWKDNRLEFEIEEKTGKTEITFTQKGLTPAYECYAICEDCWNKYIGESLVNLITQGKGQPNADGKPQTKAEQELSSN